jgi:Cytochrome P450
MRVSPMEPIIFKSQADEIWTIPPGIPVGMSSLSLHDNPSIFPNPRTFLPERWLESEDKKRELEKALVPFSRGSRQCLGMNLANAEIYLTLYAIFGPKSVGGDMTLFETERQRDVEIQRDWFNPAPSECSKGVRVLLK